MTGQPSTSPPTDRVIVWRPQAGPQHALVDCPLPEIFFGGSRGGGKTDGVLGKWALKERRFGSHFNARMFRKTTTSSDDAIERAKEIFVPLGAKFNEAKLTFRMPRGGRVSFGYLDGIVDADAQQGKNLTDAWIEEAGQHASPAAIDKLQGALRSAHGVPVQMILTANPGGAGQGWIRERYGLVPFPKGPKIVDRALPDGSVHRMAVIPSRLTDNQILVQRDPGYASRLQLVGAASLVRAWLDGDWSAIEGAFFDEWDETRHVVLPFEVPGDWLRFRSMDWGSAKPFSVGWWAVAGDDKPVGSTIIPRGALVRYREWYGCAAGQPNVGLKLTAEEVAAGIARRERDEKINYGVLDPAAFAQDGGPSLAERMQRWRNGDLRGPVFRPADNKRVAGAGAQGGWDQMRARLRGDGERPMLYVFSTCRDFIRTVPMLQHDASRAEDLDTDAEDHVADECFPAGTMIETSAGARPIETLRVGDRVETSGERAPVSAVFSVGRRCLWRASFDDGSSLTGTFDHPVFVEGFGFRGLGHLRYGDMMRTCASRSPSTAAPTIAGPSTRIDTGASTGGRIIGRFIAISGRLLTGLFRAGASSTIATRTRSTMISTTWSRWSAASTRAITGLRDSLSPSSAITAGTSSCLAHGAQLSGSVATPVNQQHDALLALMMRSETAPVAGGSSPPTDMMRSGSAHTPALNQAATLGPNRSSSAPSAGSPASREIEGLGSAPRRVVSVVAAGIAQVFNLTVEGAEEYFANGVLVHNCRYGCMSRPWVASAPKPTPTQASGYKSTRPSGESWRV